jgi:hypothetical protein
MIQMKLAQILLKEYPGRLSFTTDAWTSPNHKAYVAISVHMEHKGQPLSMILDLVEVAKVSHYSSESRTFTYFHPISRILVSILLPHLGESLRTMGLSIKSVSHI